jgi:hypothetical protein
VFASRDNKTLKVLKLDKNSVGTKAGIFIGQALMENSDYPLEKLSFSKIDLEEDGLLRILEAVRANKNIKSVNLGYINDRGLAILAETLVDSQGLKKLQF